MPEPSPTILIFGDQVGLDGGPRGAPQPVRVPLDAIKTNLRTTMESLKSIVNAMQGAGDGPSVSYVDIGIAISADGSVGLLGPGSGAIPAATMTVRLQFYRKLTY